MIKIFLACLLSVLIFTLFGCGGGGGGGSSSSNPSVPTDITVSGQVTLNGVGLSGVSVTLTGTGSSTVQTNSSGAFTFTDVQNGSYTLSAAMAGYSMSAGQPVTVNSTNVSGITFTASAITAPTYTMSGQVVTQNGTGLSGVSVTLTGTGSSTVQTNSSGAFTFTNVQNGSYTLSAAMTGYSMSAGQPVTVNSTNVSGITFTATAITAPTYTMSGQVVTQNGVGLSGVSVTLTGTGSSTVQTNSSGTFTFTNVQNGSYTLSASLTGYTMMSASQPVTVNSANVSSITFIANATTAPTYSISGQVNLNGTGLSGVSVTLTGTGIGSITGLTTPIGTFTFTNVPNGSYTLSASMTGYTMSASQPVTVNSANVSGISFTATLPQLGKIITVAGGGTQGYSGDNGAATSASLNQPHGVAVDSAGNIYIADYGNCVIRKVTAGTGIITTVAGNGTPGYSGDNGAATSANLYYPSGVAVDGAGNIYIVDTGHSVIRKVTAGTGIITTVAGNGTGGYSGDNGAATSASLYYPQGLAVDSDGNIYIADTGNCVIREAFTGTYGSGIIKTVAGNGSTCGYSGDNDAATSASLNQPYGVAVVTYGVSQETFVIADTFNNRIRMVAAGSGIINTVAGNSGTGAYSGDNGSATSASLNLPLGVVEDSAGNIYIADMHNNRIRMVSASTGIITTVAGNGTQGYSGDSGAATSANLNWPEGVAFDSAGNMYIADTQNNRIREVLRGN